MSFNLISYKNDILKKIFPPNNEEIQMSNQGSTFCFSFSLQVKKVCYAIR